MALLLVLSFSACGCIFPQQPSATLTVHFIDVGQGDSILIDLGETEVLIDGGKKNTGADEYIKPYVDGPIEAVIATHYDSDHIGGLLSIFDDYSVNAFWYNGQTTDSDTFVDTMNKITGANITVHVVVKGDTIQVGTLNFQVLNPQQPLGSEPNNNSVVLNLTYGNTDFLFMGDADKQAETDMQSLLHGVDILKVGHHGSDTSSSVEFLNIVRPAIAIIMVGLGNSYHHPSQVTIDALTDIGAKIYRTSTCGTIVVTTDGDTYSVQPNNCSDN
jgi:beta-lactamase superfamily II metal-dependent hydrolase